MIRHGSVRRQCARARASSSNENPDHADVDVTATLRIIADKRNYGFDVRGSLGRFVEGIRERVRSKHFPQYSSNRAHVAGLEIQGKCACAHIGGTRSYPFTEFPCSMGRIVNTQ